MCAEGSINPMCAEGSINPMCAESGNINFTVLSTRVTFNTTGKL